MGDNYENIDDYLKEKIDPDNTDDQIFDEIEAFLKPVVKWVSLINSFIHVPALILFALMLASLAVGWQNPDQTNTYLLIAFIFFSLQMAFLITPKLMLIRLFKGPILGWTPDALLNPNLKTLKQVISEFETGNIKVWDSNGNSMDRSFFRNAISILLFSDDQNTRKLAYFNVPWGRRFTKKLRIKKEPIETSPSTVNVNTVNNDMSLKTINLNYSDSNLEGDETIPTEYKKKNYPVNKNNWLASPTNKKFNDGIKKYEEVLPINGKEVIEINILIGARKELIKCKGKKLVENELIRRIQIYLIDEGLVMENTMRGASTSLIAKRLNGKNGNINIKDYIKP